jgi:hypothetical protein
MGDPHLGYRRLSSILFAVVLAACAPSVGDDDTNGTEAISATELSMKPIGGQGYTDTAPHGCPAGNIWRCVTDGTSLAASDGDATYVYSNAPGGLHRTLYGGAPAGAVTKVTTHVVAAAQPGGQGTVTVSLYNGRALLGAGTAHPLSQAYADQQDTFTVSVASANTLVAHVTFSAANLKYTEIWLHVTLAGPPATDLGGQADLGAVPADLASAPDLRTPAPDLGTSGTVRNVKTGYAAVGDGVHDDTSNINAAIAALKPGDALLFPAGTYLVAPSGLSRIAVNDVTVDGSGSAATIKTNGSGYILRVGGSGISSATPFTADSAELGATISADFAAIGVGAGDYVFIEQGPSGGSGARGETLLVKSVAGNVATLATAVHQSYTRANGATVQKILSPVTGLNIHDIILDGSGVATNGLSATNAVNSTFTNVAVKDALGTSGPFGSGGAVTPYLCYNVAMINLTITGSQGTAFLGYRNGNLLSSGIAIRSMRSNGATGSFGFVLAEDAHGTWSGISVDATGTGGGRPFKLNSAVYETFNSPSVNHGEGNNYNGITIEFFSAHNTFDNCSVSNMTDPSHNAHGIYLYGDVDQGNHEGHNDFNTFNNCTISNNQGYAFIVSDNNSNVTINGGTFSGLISGNYLFWLNGGCCNNIGNFSVHNATLSGPGAIGISMAGAPNSCINNNTFTAGLSAGISQSSSPGSVGSGNVLNGESSNLPLGTCP